MVEVTVNVEPNPIEVTVTVTVGGVVVGSWFNCGTFTAATDYYPSTGGTLTGGVPAAYNTFISSNGATYKGNYVPAGSLFVATINTPGQDAANWLIFGSI